MGTEEKLLLDGLILARCIPQYRAVWLTSSSTALLLAIAS